MVGESAIGSRQPTADSRQPTADDDRRTDGSRFANSCVVRSPIILSLQVRYARSQTMSRSALGEFEHHVMLALVRLGGRSRGAPIVLELESATNRTVSPAAVFVALRRLEQRGYTRSLKREPRPG